MKPEEMLQELYRLIPEAPECRKGCSMCCGPVIMLPIERDILGLSECVTPHDPEALKCKLNVDGKCSVYDKRPLTCRIFNATSGPPFACPVMEKNGQLNDMEVAIIMTAYTELLAFCPEEHKQELADAMERFESVMIEHDIRNGWRKDEGVEV